MGLGVIYTKVNIYDPGMFVSIVTATSKYFLIRLFLEEENCLKQTKAMVFSFTQFLG